MSVDLSPNEAFSHLLKLSLSYKETEVPHNEYVGRKVPVVPIFIRTLDTPSQAFVRKEDSSWLSRLIEVLSYYISSIFGGRKVRPYDLESNFTYLNHLFEKAYLHEGNFLEVDLDKTESTRFAKDFHSKPMKAIESLAHKLMPLSEKASLKPARREKLVELVSKTEGLVKKLHSKEEVFVTKKKVPTLDKRAQGTIPGSERRAVLSDLQIQDELKKIKKIKEIKLFAEAVKELRDKLTDDHTGIDFEDRIDGLLKLTFIEFHRFIRHELGLHARIRDGVSESHPRKFQERIIDICEHFHEKFHQIEKRVQELSVEGHRLLNEAFELGKLDDLADKLKNELFKCVKHHLDEIFQKMSLHIKERIKRCATLHEFYHAHEEIRHEVHDLIVQAERIEEPKLQKLFNQNMQKILKELQISQIPSYRTLLDREVLPQLQHLLTQAAAKRDSEVKDLEIGVDNLILCLKKVKDQLKEACDDGACDRDLFWLEKTIDQIEQMKGDLQRRQKESTSKHDPETHQAISGNGLRVVIANSSNTNVTIHGEEHQEAESLLSQITQGVLPSGLLQSLLSYGPTIVVTATSMYLSGGLSLGWSLFSGAALAATPPAIKQVSRHVLPRQLVPIVEPLIDFAARLVILRYGVKCVERITSTNQLASLDAGTASSVPITQAGPVAHALTDKAGGPQALEIDPLAGSDMMWSVSGFTMKAFALLATHFMLSSKKHATKSLPLRPAEA